MPPYGVKPRGLLTRLNSPISRRPRKCHHQTLFAAPRHHSRPRSQYIQCILVLYVRLASFGEKLPKSFSHSCSRSDYGHNMNISHRISSICFPFNIYLIPLQPHTTRTEPTCDSLAQARLDHLVRYGRLPIKIRLGYALARVNAAKPHARMNPPSVQNAHSKRQTSVHPNFAR